MIKLLILLILSQNSMALTPDMLDLPSHKSYFSNYYLRYFDWFNKEFFNWYEFLEKEEESLVRQSISNYKHWTINKKPVFLAGIGYDRKISYTLELYSSQSIDFGYPLKPLYKPQFYRWNTKNNSVCFSRDSHSWSCFDRKSKRPLFSRNVKPRQFHQKDFFKYDIQTNPGSNSTFYYTNEFHVMGLPEKLRPVAIKHGSQAHLPLDKIEKDEKGAYTIYYP